MSNYVKITFKNCSVLDYDTTICNIDEVADYLQLVEPDLISEDTVSPKASVLIENLNISQDEYDNFIARYVKA